MDAPTIGGVRVRKGNGETVRLPRGASLTDFAEKINVDAAALVQMLFSLGEMVTSTQSVGDETFELLAEELNYVVQIVSPEDEDRELLESFDLEFGEDEGSEEDLAARPPVVPVAVAVPVSAARPRVRSGVREGPRVAAASRSGRVARSTSRCRPRPSAACASARATARPSVFPAAPR